MRRLCGIIGLAAISASTAWAIDVVAMYRGSCRVDTGVVLRVDAKAVTYLNMSGLVTEIPRYEIIGVASYPLPALPIAEVVVPAERDAPLFDFLTFRDGALAPLATGWPIDYNAEHIQILATDGRDHLVERQEIWGVRRVAPRPRLHLQRAAIDSSAYKLRHPLTFESCPDNITPGKRPVIPVIPQTTYDSPIAIKRYHDALRSGFAKLEDYEDRQRFYAVPQYYGNRTRLGTWAILGSRYANIGSRQANFLPLVEDELSEGPFGYQRLVRSGVAPLLWSLHEEPIVQAYYGLKADYIHFEVFFDPTSPLIGSQYDYSRSQLNRLDDRLIEKGGLEFGFDFGLIAVAMAYSEGNLAIRAADYFVRDSFGLARYALQLQHNYYRAGFYAGSTTVDLGDELKHDFRFLKIYGGGRLGSRLALQTQYIARSLSDRSDDDAPVDYSAKTHTLAIEADFDVTYRWTVDSLLSIEKQTAEVSYAAGGGDKADKLWPKLAGGVTIAF